MNLTHVLLLTHSRLRKEALPYRKTSQDQLSMHIYAEGGHGFGVRKSSPVCSAWTDRCVAWLNDQGLLATNAPTK